MFCSSIIAAEIELKKPALSSDLLQLIFFDHLPRAHAKYVIQYLSVHWHDQSKIIFDKSPFLDDEIIESVRGLMDRYVFDTVDDLRAFYLLATLEFPSIDFLFVLKNLSKIATTTNTKKLFEPHLKVSISSRTFVCDRAAAIGALDLLIRAQKQRCDFGKDSCPFAAEYGAWACIKYNHENPCNWDSSTALFAAQGGHIDCLQYLHENGCERHSDDCERLSSPEDL